MAYVRGVGEIVSSPLSDWGLDSGSPCVMGNDPVISGDPRCGGVDVAGGAGLSGSTLAWGAAILVGIGLFATFHGGRN
jgi:hypothetical protein